jgi:hypothetical protein
MAKRIDWSRATVKPKQELNVTTKERPYVQNLHITDIASYVRCRRQFFYEKYLRLKPINWTNPDYFDIGTLGHSVLASKYTNKEFTWPEETENSLLVEALIKEYSLFYDDSKFEVLSVEDERKITIDGQDIYFTLDMLFTDWSGPQPMVRIMDHKFYSSLPDSESLVFDFQITAYLWLCRELAIPAKSLVLNCIRKNPSKHPEILASGKISVSQASLNSTNYDLFLEVVDMMGLPHSKYENELTVLKNRESKVFKRYQQSRTDAELDSFGEFLRKIVKDIRQDDFYPTRSSSIFDGCMKCKFKELCLHQDKKLNVRSMILNEFKQKEPNER